MVSDGELLQRYIEEGSEHAFTELVQRHVNMVYLAALRRVGRNAHAAEDVTQAVFTALARKARSLRDHPSLAGWLYTGTRFAAAQVVRTEQRRRSHEQEAQTMHELDSPAPASTDLDPFLDEIMDLLDERDRHAVLLHFFQGHTFAEVGAALALSADAARMRVNRALERLRRELARRGVASSAAVLTATLSTQPARAVPGQLAATIANHALRHAAAPVSVLGLGRFVQAAKTAPFISATAASVVLGGAGLFFYSLPSVRRPPADALTLDNRQPAARPPSGNAAAAPTQPGAPAPPVLSPSPPSTGAALAPALDFSHLSVEEKNILAMLWAQRNLAPPPSGGRWGLRIGSQAPNFKGCAPLWRKGLVNFNRLKDFVSLNELGRAFCEAHTKEIDAYPISNYKRTDPAR